MDNMDKIPKSTWTKFQNLGHAFSLDSENPNYTMLAYLYNF
jgi:hypothetical protein